MPQLAQRRTTTSDLELRAELRDALLETTREAMAGVHEADLVDYPDHYNAGDAALWVGQRSVLRRLGIRVASVSTRSTYERRRLRADGPIVLLGGGNLGGLYATHHQLKLSVLADFKGRPVIQLPQSLRYAGERERDQLRRGVAEHGATTLILRDRDSFELARRDFDCPVKLAPDVAFGLDPLHRRRARRPIAVQVRTDKESAGSTQSSAVETFDWLEAHPYEPVAIYQAMHRVASRVARRNDSAATRRAFLMICDSFGQANLRRGVSMLSRGDRLVTDRLHGHILACLAGIDHIVVNDRFGKIEAMWRTWTNRFSCAQFAPTWAEAGRLLPQLKAGTTSG